MDRDGDTLLSHEDLHRISQEVGVRLVYVAILEHCCFIFVITQLN